MRFTVALLASALSAVAVAQSTSASPTQSIDSAQASVVACLDGCDDDDVGCKARCNPVPNPTEDQIIKTEKCVRECDQGDGSDAESKAYEMCQSKCIADNYYNTSEGTPQATGGAGSGSSGNGGSGNGGSGSDDADSTATDSANGADSTGDSSSGGSGSGNSGSNDDSSDDSEESGSSSNSDETSTETGSAAEDTDSPDAASQLVGSGAAVFALAAAVFAL